MVKTLHGHERRVLRARYVTWPHLADELIARRLGLPAHNLDTLLLAAHLHFGQHWLQWQPGGGMSSPDKPLPAKVCDVLAVAPRPLFLGEIEAALEFAYDKAEIMSVLVKLQAQGKMSSTLRPRQGPGPKVAKGHFLSWNTKPDFS